MRKIYRRSIIPLCMVIVLILGYSQGLKAQSTGTEVAILDPDLPDVDVLVKGLKPGVKVAFFDKSKSIVASISAILDQNAPVSALHVITHGNAGFVSLSYDLLSSEVLKSETTVIKSWKTKFANGGDILLYGCDIAKNESGKTFVDLLSSISGVDVAASIDKTGSSKLGLNWNLEYTSGTIEAGFVFNSTTSVNYKYTLYNVLVLDIDGGGYWNGQIIADFYTSKGHTGSMVSELPASLSTYQLIWVVQPTRLLTIAEISSLQLYLDNGGTVIFQGEHSGWQASQNANISDAVLKLGAHFSIVVEATDGGWTTCNLDMKASGVIKNHPLMEGVNTLDYNYMAPIGMGGSAEVLVSHRTDPTKTYMAIESVSNGSIVMWADQNIWDNVAATSCNQNAIFFMNLLNYSVSRISDISKAILTTTEAYSISGSGATSGGNITSDKGSTITERGICWATSTVNPTTANSKSTAASGGTGMYTCPITGLSLNTTYYVRAYAINGNGTAYGNSVTFKTPAIQNISPTAVADNFSCQKNGTISENIMSNDFDGDADAMTATIVTKPSYHSGTFTLNANGSFTYTNNGTNAPSDFFSYYLTDSKGSTSSTVSVGIAIFTPSFPPVGADGSVNVTAGEIFSFAASNFTFSDADAGHVFNGIKLVSAPAKGLLKYNGFSVAIGSVYNDVSKLTFDNNNQAGGSPFATFTFKLVASSGEESASAYTMSIMLSGGKTAQTITFNALSPASFGMDDIDPGATTSSNLDVTYASDNTAVATIVNGKIRIDGIGTAGITASQAGNVTFDAAVDVKQTITVGKGNQIITFNNLSDAIYGDADILPGATTTSGLAISYASSNLSVVTIVSGKIHIVGTGTANITASQAGDANYNAGDNAIQSIVVNKSDQNITFSSLADVIYGKADFNPGGSASSNLIITYTSDNLLVATIVDGKIHIVGVGTVNIMASQTGNANYNGTDDVIIPLTVNKASLSVVALDKSKIYGDVNPVLTFSYSGFAYEESSSVLTSIPTVSTAATDASSVGNYVITPAGGEADNYSFEYENGQLTINQKTLTVTANPQTKVYGDNNPVLTVVYSGFVGSEDESFLLKEPIASTVANNFSNVGVYAIIPGDGTDDNYSFNYVEGSLTIGKKDLTATADDKGKSYGDANPGFTISYAGFINEDDESVVDIAPTAATTATASSPVKTYPISLTGGIDNNYNILLVNGNLVVNLRNLTITAQDKAKTYGEVNPELTLIYSGFVNGDNESKLTQVPSIATIATTTSNAGNYDITLSGGSDEFYTFFFVNASLTINKKELTVVAEDKTKVYGEVNPTFTFTYTGFIDGENDQVFETAPVGLTSANQLTGVGTYVVTPGNAVDNNYSFTYLEGNLTITKKDLHVKAADKSKIYGEINPELTIDYEGYVNEDASRTLQTVPELATLANSMSVVGSYPITITGGASDNYNLLLANGTLTVDKKELTVTAEPKTKVYGEANPELTFIYDGFVNEDSKSVLTAQPAIAVTATALSGVAVYPITLSGGTAENYTFTLINDNLTITQKDLTVTAVNKYKAVGRPNPTFTFIYAGFVNGETSSALTALPTGSTEASTYTSAGDYDISPVNAASINYNFIYEKGVLRITSIAGDKDGDGKITTPEIAGDEDCDGKITSPELAGDTNGDGGIGSPEIAGDLNGDGKISGGEVNGDTSGDGKITAPELAGDTNGDGTIDGNEIAGDLNGDGTITVNEVAGDTSGDGKITSPEVAGDINGDGTISSPEIIGDISGDKKIDGNEIAGDGNGDSTINSNEVRAIDPAKDHPNVDHLFSPNSDGYNDYWKIPEVEKYGRIQVKIYNRWGGLVYESTNYQNDWNGTSSGKPVPEGAYFYFITSEKEGKKSGVINIVR